jgi:hypothetical protein
LTNTSETQHIDVGRSRISVAPVHPPQEGDWAVCNNAGLNASAILKMESSSPLTHPGARMPLDDSGSSSNSPATMYINSVADALVKEQQDCQREIEAEIESLKVRLNLAERRIRAASNGDSNARRTTRGEWMSSGVDVLAMKKKLSAAASDEAVLMELVDEVRQKKEELTNLALLEYARRTKRILDELAV